MKQDCLLGAIGGDGEQPIFQMFLPLDQSTRDRALTGLGHIESEYRKVGLSLTADVIVDLIGELNDPRWQNKNFQWLIDQISHIENLADKQLRERTFFYVPLERAKYFRREGELPLFGQSVADSFARATYDIREAGCCLGLARFTAAVFHLMRVLEVGLSALGTKFDVSLEHTNWGPAIEQIDSRIKGMHKDPLWKELPDCKEQQEFYSQAVSHFEVLKNAWRNYTMHRRAFYTEEQAEEIYNGVRGFMQKLATRLNE
jgi:hypothetical protein